MSLRRKHMPKPYGAVSITRGLELSVNIEDEIHTVRLDRLAAQGLAAALTAFSGGRIPRGLTLNATRFTRFAASPVTPRVYARVPRTKVVYL
jgi:hypothetical protein